MKTRVRQPVQKSARFPRRQRAGLPGRTVKFGSIPDLVACRVVLYGCGGCGKTPLAASAPGPVALFDLDGSLPVLRNQLPSGLDLRPVGGIQTWQDLRGALIARGWDGIRTIVIDSATRAEEMAADWVVANVPHEKGCQVTSVSDYRYGIGYRHVYDEFVKFLADLDQHVRAGRNVVLTAHESAERHPNPLGEDKLRAEPRLQHSPKSSIRERVRDWCDSLLHIGCELEANAGMTVEKRIVHPCQLSQCMAKSRIKFDPVVLDADGKSFWMRFLSRM